MKLLGWALFILFECYFYFLHGFESLLLIHLTLFTVGLSYCGLRIVLKPFESILLVVLFLCSVSFIDSNSFWFLPICALFLLSLSGKHRRSNLWNEMALEWRNMQGIQLGAYSFVAILIASLFIESGSGAFVYDMKHPTYELSIGHSYNESILKTPDLSYSGKEIRYHFFSTRLALLMHKLTGLDELMSIYFGIPFVCLGLFFAFHANWNREFPDLPLNAGIIFFIPFLGFGFQYYDSILSRMILFVPSYTVAFLFSCLSLALLMKRKYLWCGLATLSLLITKASFFLTMLGGLILFAFFRRDFHIFYKLILPLFVLFLLIFKVFLSGAHGHNLWILLPTFLFQAAKNPSFSHLFGQSIGLFWCILSLIFFWRSIRADETLGLISAIPLSAFIGMSLVTEVTEGNSYQFLYGSYFALALLAHHFIRISSRLVKTAIIVLSLLNLFCVGYDCLNPLLRSQNLKLKLEKNRENLPTEANFSKSLLHAYRGLKNFSGNGKILFAKYYEWDTDIPGYRASQGFIRSALSHKQCYFENFHYKGILMEKDLPERFAKSLHFYKNFSILSASSQAAIEHFYSEDFGISPGYPLSNHPIHGNKAKLLHYLSLGKEWCGLNISAKIWFEVAKRLKSLPLDHQWAYEFLKNERIQFIIFENGDYPSKSIQQWLEPLAGYDDITVFAFKDFE